ncbi:hypothetical protein [Poseidonocella sp. HB161398]|uniref:hypothetical protein n=1 Tax=Poseidonocella sp. HB161398 TaxID=2320855 RepID=UPI001109DCCA|nr:hypothetical protein [Poseidonocella sp. HB161398]
MTTTARSAASPDMAAGHDGPGHMPILGIIPRSPTGQIFLGWAVLNFLLALLPAYDIIGNGTAMVAGFLPLTVFYCYAVFTLNCVFGLCYFLVRGRAWAVLDAHYGGGEAGE